MRIAHVLLLAVVGSAVLAGLSFRSAPDTAPVSTHDDANGEGPTSRPAAESVYLQAIGIPDELWCLDGQGEPRALPAGVIGDPSHALHGGARWFLTASESPDETYPDGSVRRELFCVREDGHAVRLTDDPNLEAGPFAARWPRHGGDTLVSWIAREWDDEGRIVRGGIYTAPVRFDRRGNVAGLAAEPELRVAMDLAQDPGRDWSRLPVPDICGYDWSPDGRAVVLETLRQRLWIVDVDSAVRRELIGEPASDPAWSPCGTRIAFKRMESYGAIATIRPDDGQVRDAIFGMERECVVCRPIFSPDGDELAYARFRPRFEPGTTWGECTRARVATVGDGRDASYTLDVPEGLVAVAWREGVSQTTGEERRYASRD